MNPELKDKIRASRPSNLNAPDLDRIHRRGRRRRIGLRTAAAGGSLAVVALAAIGLGQLTAQPVAIDPVGLGGETAGPAPTHTGSAAPTTTTDTEPSPSATPEAACGNDLPIIVPAPGAYDGPTHGVSPHRTAPVEPGQLLAHWTSDTGTIEVRWPADEDAEFWGDEYRIDVGEATQQPNDMWAQTLSVPVTGITEAGCTRMQVTVHDETRAGLDETFEAMLYGSYLPVGTPLVAEARSVDALPTALSCNAPAGITPPPNQGGQVEGTSHEDPEDALAAFLDEHRGLLQAEYVALHLPDGSMAYGQPDPGGRDGYITVIHVAQTTGGWQVDSWDGSSC